MGHNQAGVKAGASVDVFLKEGLMSKALLRQVGKLPLMENIYERALRNREEWIEGRKIALGNNQSLLERVLDSDRESNWVRGEEIFYRPGHLANREENVFFGYSDHPSSKIDWVAIEVPETATLHDASCRDRGVPDEWSRTAVTIRQFREMKARGETPRGWKSGYNEHLIRDIVPAERIVAYAKVEKELPVEKPISAEELEQVQNFVSNKLGFATQFDDPKDNVLVHEDAGKYQIRVSFNKAKVTGREDKVSDFFDQFQSFQELISKAKIFSTPKHLPKNHPKHHEYQGGGQEQKR